MKKIVTFREASIILKRNGFKPDHKKGDHHHFIKDGKRIVISYNLNPMIWKRLVKENNLNVAL